MKVAIIGANGFIGTRLVEQFHLGNRHEVVPLVRKPSSLALPARFAVDWRIADALDRESLAAGLRGCDAVVHAAIGDPRQIELMPEVLCAAAAAAGIRRVVCLSSASVHGQAPAPGTTDATPLRTDHALDYNNAKVRAEQSFFAEAARARLQAFALRPGVVFGPRSRWIADLAKDLRDGTAWLYRGGDGICNSIYVDNLVDAIDVALRAPAGAAGAYLVGDSETVTWREFYLPVAAKLGIPAANIESLDKLPVFTRTTRDKIERAVASPSIQALLPAVPHRLKQFTKAVLASGNGPARPSAWSLPASPKSRITEELALLQQCRWKLPHTKAQSGLGYAPSTTFADGMVRSLAWLAFAEGGGDLAAR
ncbi:MAG TPA: NAD(P)-dependent oxidoreductase [Candidatus Synoicihabitans sp.]|nr:NAD(P)-dependent oxidoreductase [Candidatus Synoicihabitans sp.]